MFLDHFPYGFGNSSNDFSPQKNHNTVMENHDLSEE